MSSPPRLPAPLPLTGATAALALAAIAFPQPAPGSPGDRGAASDLRSPNVLFLVVDDLRPQLACYGHEEMVTPRLDSLAASGTRFAHAFCNLPVCGPSRASVMSGLRPDPGRFTRRTARADEDAPDAVPLHTHFQSHGYHTVSNGKVFDRIDDHRDGWSEPPWKANAPGRFFDCYVLPESLEIERRHQATPVVLRGRHRGPAYEAADVPDEAYTDGMMTERALDDLRRLAAAEAPFFLAVGYPRPHLPFIAPKRYWDLYDRDAVPLPEHDEFPADAPEAADRDWNELRLYAGIPNEGPLPADTARTLAHGYRACVSYIDALVGRLLDELVALGIEDETIVVLWGDHGFHLGERGMWCKHSCFEETMRVPLLLRAPGLPSGVVATELVELVDLYPTLCDLAGLPQPAHLEGRSLAPLLKGEGADGWDLAVGRMYNAETLRSESARYTEFYDPGSGDYRGRMLYDLIADPGETQNLSERPEEQERVAALSALLRSRLPESHPLRRSQGAPAPSANP